MSTQAVQHEELAGDSLLCRRFRSCGLLILRCDERGVLLPYTSDREDWYEQLCTRSPLFRRALEDAAARWIAEPTPNPYEAFPGLWLAPAPVMHRRRRRGSFAPSRRPCC